MALLGVPQSLWHKLWAQLCSLNCSKLTFVEQAPRLCNEVLKESIHRSRMLHRGAAITVIAVQANAWLKQRVITLLLSVFHCCILKRWKSSLCKCRASLVRTQVLQEHVHTIKPSDQNEVKKIEVIGHPSPQFYEASKW